jgi:predicted DNA-binding transcriptional regulator AlpA
MRSELQAALHLAETSSPAEIPALLGELEQIRVTALARLSSPVLVCQPDELLDVGATAKRLGVSQDYLYRHQRKFPFARRIGRKLLFSSSGLDKFLARK